MTRHGPMFAPNETYRLHPTPKSTIYENLSTQKCTRQRANNSGNVPGPCPIVPGYIIAREVQ